MWKFLCECDEWFFLRKFSNFENGFFSFMIFIIGYGYKVGKEEVCFGDYVNIEVLLYFFGLCEGSKFVVLLEGKCR